MTAGRVIDVDPVTATEELFEPDQRCVASFHEYNHVRCDAPAPYVVSWVDTLHEVPFQRPMCASHVADYFRAAIVSGWCPCAFPHRDCPTTGVRIDLLR